ncbi:WYL domain-containing protein [soil metagenome]
MVPWIVAAEGPTINEISRRFGLSRHELSSDLDVIFMVGVHPFTPDELIEVVVEDDRVWIRYADVFARPLRLTPAEGLAVLGAGASLLAVPGADPDGPLARGLAKLARVVGADDGLEVSLGTVATATLELLRQATRQHRSVELAYYSFGRDERTRRTVDPWRVFADAGQWYVVGHCHEAGGERVFRVDRIEEAVAGDHTFEPPPDTAPPDGRERPLFEAGPDQPRVTLDLAPAARWVAAQYPMEEVTEQGKGHLRVTLAVGARPWLERLLLRLGPEATLIDVPETVGGPALRRDAARRVLARYGRRGGPEGVG